MTQLITVVTTNYDIAPAGPKHLTNNRYVDEKNAELSATVRQYEDQRVDAAKRYANDQDTAARCA